MALINTLGAIGKGYTEGTRNAVELRKAEREDAIKNYELKKAQKEDAKDQRWIPASAFWPNWKDMPETVNSWKTAFAENGLENDIREVGGMPYVRAGAAKEMLTISALSSEMQKKQTEAMKSDMQNQYLRLKQMVEGGVDAEGNKIKEADLPAIQKKLKTVETSIGGLLELEKAAEMKMKIIDKMNSQRERKPGQFREQSSGRLIDSDKQGNYFYAGTNEIYSGSTKNLIPISQETGVTVKSTPASVTVHNTGAGKERAPKVVFIRKKKGKGYEEDAVDANDINTLKQKIKEGWERSPAPKDSDNIGLDWSE